MIPHPSKKARGGEDACFTSESILCVADGVGGWAEHGINPAIYARSLCNQVKINHEKYTSPYQLFQIAAKNSKKIIGSSTFSLTRLDGHKIKAVNFGDSGYVMYRKQGSQVKSVVASEVMQHSFNFPFQVGSEGDDPSQAKEIEFDVQHKDIIVMGTDGLWDNVFSAEIEKILSSILSVDDIIKDASLVAKLIALKAEKLSNDETYKSPFSEGSGWLGGKPDDITVVIGQVIE